jgi:ubiquitin C-terminal hydrolase
MECIESYFKEEVIDDVWKCESCKRTSKPVKRSLRLSYTPNILVLHMKRFSVFPRKEKIKCDLTYPDKLEMMRYN